MRCEIELPTDKIEWRINGEGNEKLSGVNKKQKGKGFEKRKQIKLRRKIREECINWEKY